MMTKSKEGKFVNYKQQNCIKKLQERQILSFWIEPVESVLENSANELLVDKFKFTSTAGILQKISFNISHFHKPLLTSPPPPHPC